MRDKYYRGINVGSTTDYRSHVHVVEKYETPKNTRVDDFIGYREIPLFDYREDLMTEVLKSIGEYGGEQNGDPNFQNIIMPIDDWIKEERSLDLIDASFSTLKGSLEIGVIK